MKNPFRYGAKVTGSSFYDRREIKAAMDPLFAWYLWFVLQTFWLYCTHNIFMIYIRSRLRFICGTSDIVVAILPFVCTPIVIVLSLLAAKTMANRLPRVYAVLCGGRG